MANAAPDRTGRGTDLTQRDWLETGQSLLRRGGLRALKLRPLAAELNVSTGSFYHQFTDFDAYQGQLADYFAGDHLASVLDTIMAAERNPVDRIRLLAEIVRRRGLFRLSIAMRAWAESDLRARVAVERSDAQVLGFLSCCLEANGLSSHQARVRGYALMTLGLGKVHAPDLDRPALMEELIALLCTPTDATAATAGQEERAWLTRASTISS